MAKATGKKQNPGRGAQPPHGAGAQAAFEDELSGVSDAELAADAVALRGLRHSNGWIFGTMLLSAVISLIAAFTLSWDAVKLAADSAADLSCNFSEVISCGTVAVSWQAKVFGFPNAFLGMIAEPVVITIAVAGLAGVRFPRWFMFTAQVIYLFGLIFALWLFSQSMWVIGALCPWCMVITVSTSLVFLTLAHYNIREDNLYLPPAVQQRVHGWVRKDYDLYAGVFWIAILAALVFIVHGAEIFG